MLVALLPAGLLVGLALGALGGGGSILTVPALVYLFGQDAAAATTGSLIIVGISALVGMVPHLRAGRVRAGQGLAFGLLGVLGAYAGARAATAVPGQVLLAGFAVLMLIVAALMTRRRRRLRRSGGVQAPPDRGPALTLRPWRCRCRRVAVVVLAAAGVGLLTGFFGVGGGFAVVPALVLVLGLPMPVAAGTSLLVIAVNSVTALAARATQQVDLDWVVIGGFTAAAVAGSLLGSRVVSRVSPDRLGQVFTVLLVVVALYTGARSVAAL